MNNAPKPNPIAEGITLTKPSPVLISIAGDSKLQKLAATITPPVKPSIPSKAILLIDLNKNTEDAPRAVTPHVNMLHIMRPIQGQELKKIQLFDPYLYIVYSIYLQK